MVIMFYEQLSGICYLTNVWAVRAHEYAFLQCTDFCVCADDCFNVSIIKQLFRLFDVREETGQICLDIILL